MLAQLTFVWLSEHFPKVQATTPSWRHRSRPNLQNIAELIPIGEKSRNETIWIHVGGTGALREEKSVADGQTLSEFEKMVGLFWIRTLSL